MKDTDCSQKKIFTLFEGDQYYCRNKDKLNMALQSWENDPVIRAISYLGLQPKSILEIGCGNGWRLHALANCCHARCFGIDPSAKAIKEGSSLFTYISLLQATADEIPFGDLKFDLVVSGFCLYLCDRQDLFKIAYEVDRVLMENGDLVILDFHPPFPYRNMYAHCEGVISYKMDYSRLFTGNPAYFNIYQYLFTAQPETIHLPDKRMSVTVLHKNTEAAYPSSPYQEV